MSANILIEASRHELGTHVQKAVYIEIFRKDIQPVIQAVPLLPHIIIKVRERMAVCLILVILTDNLCKGNHLFCVFHNAFGTPELQHIGLEETASAKDKRQHLLDVWFGRIEAETKFCVETTIEAEDEWLHAFYYFNDEIPTEKDFENTMADYLTFEFNMITHGRGYLFEDIKNGENNE